MNIIFHIHLGSEYLGKNLWKLYEQDLQEELKSCETFNKKYQNIFDSNSKE
jgi:hypothetical protein